MRWETTAPLHALATARPGFQSISRSIQDSQNLSHPEMAPTDLPTLVWLRRFVSAAGSCAPAGTQHSAKWEGGAGFFRAAAAQQALSPFLNTPPHPTNLMWCLYAWPTSALLSIWVETATICRYPAAGGRIGGEKKNSFWGGCLQLYSNVDFTLVSLVFGENTANFVKDKSIRQRRNTSQFCV